MMKRFVLAASPLILLALPSAAAAQDEGTKIEPSQACQQQSESRRRSRSVFGSVLGSVAGTALGRAGVPTGVVGIAIPVGSLLSEAIISMLDCREQQQAAEATNEAVRGGVGTTSNWTSDTRPGVSGSSSVTGDERLADGTHCMTVTDVVIVDGEETTVPKRMCRGPGQGGYARV
jgi:surface antigen